MARPKRCRRVASLPETPGLQPEHGAEDGADVILAPEEFEAIRLADHEGFYQDAAAERMGVSRPTFGRILAAARRKLAAALIEGRRLRLAEAGPEIVHFDAAPARARCRCPWSTDGLPPVDAPCPRCRGQRAHGGHGRRRRAWAERAGERTET